MLKPIAAALLAASFAAPAFAAPQPVEIDLSHTRVWFYVNHLGFSDMYGDFTKFDIDLKVDPENLANSTVSASIDTSTVDMRHEGLNKHLKNADFFNVEQFPAMSFETTGVTQNGEGKLAVAGNLTLLGVTKPVTLDVTVNKIGEHPMRKTPWVGFNATATIKRSDFGMNYAVPAVGDDIKISIGLEGALKAAE
ncbi:YceI family protein [Aquimonas voraii]|uniref:Polyisoprenoid-binding protein YceI n=1 Tax=Aquimonas voraii TaxID=265719 RepID=A0A1G6YLL1_9GAMM|nr:YceI family protein [Aquimonas voraii]SDD91394.1 Polyisoprenoid-binding protein YceI [Aquimonas voraii]